MSVVVSKVASVTATISPYSMISREEFEGLREEIKRKGKVTIGTVGQALEENEIRLIVDELPY